MSDKEDKSSNNEGTTQTNLEEGTENPEIISEGNKTIDSIKKSEEFSAISQNMPQSMSLEGSGDDIVLKIESELKEMAEESTITDADIGNGDNIAETKANELDDKETEYIDTDIDLNEAISSKTDDLPEKDESNNFDENKLEKIDDLDDEDMELRWDDDDSSNIAAGDENLNSDTKNNELLSEDQLLEEPSDVIAKEMSETHSDENSKASENNLLKDQSEENSLNEGKTSEDIKTTNESEIVPKLSTEKDIPTEKTEDDNTCKILEDKHLEETVMNAEMINSPEMIFSSEESLDHTDIKILEDKLLEDAEMSTEVPETDIVKEITVEKGNDEPLKEMKTEKSDSQKEVPTNYESKEDLDIIEEDILLAESESNIETENAKFKMQSFMDVILDKVNDNVTSVKNLLKETDPIIGSGHIPAEDTESSGIISTNKDKEDDDVLLEEKLLEEPDTAGDIPETDATMDVDEEKEGELLKDNESEDGITPMDVDTTDLSIEDQVKIDDKIEDSSMVDQSEVVMEDTAHPIDQKTEIEKPNEDQTTDHISDKDRSDDQAKTSETVIDQPIEDTAKTVDISKETAIGEHSQTVTAVINKEVAIEDADDVDEEIAAEIAEEGVCHQPIDDKNRIEDSNKDQSTVESNTTTQSENSSKQTDTLPISSNPNVVDEEIEKSVVEKEIENKLDTEKPELTTKSVNPDNNLDKNKTDEVLANITFETANPDKNLDKTNETDDDSHNNSSLHLEDPPICIKTDHSLHKPDVMLEIPTQELIDMDDTDFSMNLDQSEVVDSTNDVDEDVEHERTADKMIALDEDANHEKTVDKTITDGAASDKTVDTVNQKAVDQEAIVTKQTTVAEDVTASDKTVDTVNKISVDSEAVVTEKTDDKIITDTLNQEAVDQESVVAVTTVSEVQTDGKVESASDKKVKDTVVHATIEENMEKMFADDETDVVKEVPESVATTSQAEEPTKQPSTSTTQMTPDTSDEVPEISDSLGLLAESAGRMMEDDEEPDDDDDADEDDDFDQDESSNQISAEQSEDSNPAAIESEPLKDQEEKILETADLKDEEMSFMKMDVDIEEYGTLELQAESMHQMNEETKSAVDALLRDNAANNQVEEQKQTTEQMDIETVKLSDTSDNEIDVEPTEVGQAVAEPSKEVEEKQVTPKKSPSKSPSKSDVSPKPSPTKLSQSPCKQSPNKLKNLAITTQEASSFLNIVDLEESSSSEDDIQEVQKPTEPETKDKETKDKPPSPDSDVTNVNIPTGIEIMCTSGGNTSEITTKEGEVVISGVPKPPPHKPARLNTSEVSIKTVSTTESIVIPETKMNELNQATTQPKRKLSLEIFNLDSDEEDSAAKEKSPHPSPQKMTASELDKARETNKCINYACKSDCTVPYKVAEPAEVAYYDAGRKRRSMVCQPCADVVANRSKNLMQGIKDMTPILDLDMGSFSQDLVQISDSESEDEDMTPEEPKEPIGEKGAKFIEDNLAKYLNETWKKYEMDVRLKETQIMLDDEIEKLEQDSKEIDAMLNECQIATDKLRNELYATFEGRRQELPAIILYDTPESKYIGLEEDLNPPSPAVPPSTPTPPPVEASTPSISTRRTKRRLSSTSETPAKRPAIPLGYAPLGTPEFKEKEAPIIDYKIEDDTDISVVKLSSEAAPAELPPPGEISRPPLRVSMPVYAMKNAFGPWLKGKILEIQPKSASGGNPFSLCRVKFDHKTKTTGKVLAARCIAYSEPADVRMTIGTRLIALFKDTNRRESYYSGVVAEIPNPVNNYRYLVFFDDGYAQYVQHQYTRLVCESSPLVWEEVHPFSREFVRKYLLAYPERPMVRLHEGQHLKTEWNGKWWSSRITRVDASLAQVMFVGDGRREWIYRGSTRLAPLYLELRAAQRHRVRPMPRSKAQPRLNMPYVEYTRSDEPGAEKHAEMYAQHQHQQQNEEIRRQRAVAKKSTSAPPQIFPPSSQQVASNAMDPVTSRVVYYTPKNAVKPLKMVPHKCSPKCKRTDVLSLKDLRTYNPLAKPLLSGWERQIIRYKGHKEVMYRAPCGRRLRNMRELHIYLRSIESDLPVDLFDFHHATHCLAEFVLNKCLVGKKDLSHGKENVPVPCVNYYDDSLPEFCSYNTERTPTAGVPLNLAPEFLCGCDCTDDCQDKSKCACWKMTLEGARTIGLKGPNVGYVYRRLPEPLPSGIYECNSRCKCKHTCLNRVAQQPLQLKLQVFKTPNRGWGIRALNDVPKGSFLCVYAGNLLTDATANLDGLNEGDEYLAELDYIEVVEQMKEGYEEDIPDADKKLIKKELAKEGEESDEDEPSSSEEEDTASKTDKEDDDFRPGYIGLSVAEFSKRLRKREKTKKEKEEPAADEKDTIKDMNKDPRKDTIKEGNQDTNTEENKDTIKDEIKEETKEPNGEEECITISDDEEVREPSRFTVQDNMKANEYISKYKSVRTLFGMDEACYIMDAKVQGNIGRYLNHSCCPNVFVQNVFVDTHDPRFPWVAFFALSHIKAGTELTWNYNYDVGSVPGKILYCYCGAANCRGRLL